MSAVGLDQILLNAQSTDETKSVAVSPLEAGCASTDHYINWGTGVSSGVVQIEVADNPDYTGTWAPVRTVTYDSGSPKQDYVSVSGAPKAIRHRIETAVGGGTVTTRIVGVTQ